MEMSFIVDRKTGKITAVGGMTEEKKDALARMILRMAAIMSEGEKDEAMWKRIAEAAERRGGR